MKSSDTGCLVYVVAYGLHQTLSQCRIAGAPSASQPNITKHRYVTKVNCMRAFNNWQSNLINGCSLTKHGTKWVEVANGGFIQMHTQITKVTTNLTLF